MSARKSTYVFEYRITLLGAEKVGKSALIHQFTEREFLRDYTPTAEDHLTHVVEHNGNMCVCLFVDTAGGDDFPAMRKLSLTKGNAFFVLYAINDYKSFERAKLFVEEIKSLKGDEEEIKIVIVGNKTDEKDRKITFEEGLHYTASLHERNVLTRFVETSSKDYKSVTNVIHELLTMFLPPPSQMEVPVIKKFERRLSIAKRLRQRRTSKGLIDRKTSVDKKTQLKESLSDSEISLRSETPPASIKSKSQKVRKRSNSQPEVKLSYGENHKTTPKTLRKQLSTTEISNPTLNHSSISLSRSSLLKQRSVSVNSNSSDSGVDNDCSSPQFSPVCSPKMNRSAFARRASMPEQARSTKIYKEIRKASMVEKVRGIFKRTKSISDDTSPY